MPISRLAPIYYADHSTLVARCELRDGLRNFRANRVVRATLLEQDFKGQSDSLRALWVVGWQPI